MANIQSPKLLWFKGFLFLAIGVLSLLGIMLESSPKVLLLAMVAVWSFCRAYYFAFYVIENYIDTAGDTLNTGFIDSQLRFFGLGQSLQMHDFTHGYTVKSLLHTGVKCHFLKKPTV